MTLKQLITRYIFFASIATVVNLLTQRMVLSVGQNQTLFLSAVVLGTLTGLATKYLLDKRWIFYDARTGLEGESRKFALYTMMGVATTAIFWSMETVFGSFGKQTLCAKLAPLSASQLATQSNLTWTDALFLPIPN